MENEVREKTLYTIEEALLDNEAFFDAISHILVSYIKALKNK